MPGIVGACFDWAPDFFWPEKQFIDDTDLAMIVADRLDGQDHDALASVFPAFEDLDDSLGPGIGQVQFADREKPGLEPLL